MIALQKTELPKVPIDKSHKDVGRLYKHMHSPLMFFFLFLSGIFYDCAESYKPLKEEVREPDATIRFSSFKRSSNAPDGKLQWNLTSEEAYMYEKDKKQSRIVVYHFTFTHYEDKESTKITAERGEINYDTQSMIVSGKVIYNEGNIRRIESDTLKYDLESKVLETTNPVRIYEKGTTTVCKRGVMVDKLNKRQVCRGPEVVQIKDSSNPGSNEDFFQ